MSQQYRICHNCGASLTPDQAYCPHCGARYMEPVIQQPVVPPPSRAQGPDQPQGQTYAPPPTQSPYYPSSYGQQEQMAPQQIGGYPPSTSPRSGRGVSPFLIIALVVIMLLLLVGTGSLFYNLGQRNSSNPGTTPVPGNTPVPTPTSGTAPIPTPTTKITPGTTPTSFRAPARSIIVFL